MIYCSQPKALKSTATGEQAREVASERRRRRAKESVKKGEGRNGEKCALQTTVRKIEGKTNRARGAYSGKEPGQKVGSDSGLRSEAVRERYVEGRVEKEQGRRAAVHKEMKPDQNRKHRLVDANIYEYNSDFYKYKFFTMNTIEVCLRTHF